ncbi:MAG: tRNA (adenosine(37)-N6)-threonylcarbamoyltransferase complex ATPase subunit type 1 TsaE [Endomicrobium sp.]|jgi:tRNA threonylcarbamoyladenosine biosynthesis protein TsaE|nr:tRNA (adenosine(37)-N6)-threonylcarbamoyltransferase complex ATPase subunit type 1 TsaE [Endomicrobium sp.]
MAKNKKQFIRDISTSEKNIFISKTPGQTRRLGAKFAALLKRGDIVFLKGDLGSGKTTFTQGVARAFGNKGFARSSSFMLVNEYKGGKISETLFHLDLYRLKPASVWDMGIEEYLYGQNVSLIEWPDRILGGQNDNNWNVELETAAGGDRKITIEKTK